MKPTLLLLAFAAAFALTAPAFAMNPNAQVAQQAEEATTAADETQPEQGTAPEPEAMPAERSAPNEAEEEELICRSIRLDMSSRRKTRVCRTEEGWRELNQRR